MKHMIIASSLLILSAAAYALPGYRTGDMPRNPRADSACISKTTASTAGNCPRQVFSPEKNQAIEGYSPVYHKD
ncbi:hypothetical protein [Acerihabitans arboris]|uniref:Uncharacterized protein n=1 Tax=Acerihabitans arboris TaxID=2691583 RepID=A0A845SD65_9GAMM|nr:hypothetical protein [Acerihabitans arboris]NDL62853.1 hypothetical protein [Acerihabitans arboris]